MILSCLWRSGLLACALLVLGGCAHTAVEVPLGFPTPQAGRIQAMMAYLAAGDPDDPDRLPCSPSLSRSAERVAELYRACQMEVQILHVPLADALGDLLEALEAETALLQALAGMNQKGQMVTEVTLAQQAEPRVLDLLASHLFDGGQSAQTLTPYPLDSLEGSLPLIRAALALGQESLLEAAKLNQDRLEMLLACLEGEATWPVVEAIHPGTVPGRTLLVTAHLDAFPWQEPVWDLETPVQGLDDNASGVAAAVFLGCSLAEREAQQEVRLIHAPGGHLYGLGLDAYLKDHASKLHDPLALVVDRVGSAGAIVKDRAGLHLLYDPRISEEEELAALVIQTPLGVDDGLDLTAQTISTAGNNEQAALWRHGIGAVRISAAGRELREEVSALLVLKAVDRLGLAVDGLVGAP